MGELNAGFPTSGWFARSGERQDLGIDNTQGRYDGNQGFRLRCSIAGFGAAHAASVRNELQIIVTGVGLTGTYV